MLKGKNALVTGSTSGIGQAIAEGFAKQGMNIMLNGFGDKDAIEKQRSTMASTYGVKVGYYGADISKPAEIYAMTADAVKQFGRVDVLVNNAGIQQVAPIEDFPDDKWEAIIRINLISAFYTTKSVFKAMKAAKWGRIINISSIHGLVASPDKTAYVAAKHGIVGLTKTVALEGAEFGITVNAICPGYAKTPLVEKQIPDTAKARGMSEADVVKKVILAEQPTHQFVTVEQISGLATFLCTDEAASITGAALSIDGGWTAQ
jgi:3-hydroxybutyrate dehydrogenase